ncbi:MAG: metalloregulator ArsR/SmtB family transcription factor [Candidatus Cloacimonadaceae bacterium]|nr:metalloregulator ArsR/SmtB family transcription factor [Candidatus Cloacimonadaceae bacterium]
MAECKCKLVDPVLVEEIESRMPSMDEIERLGEFFRVFGDFTRLKIIYYLSHMELCVADLSTLVGMQQPAVSQHLKTLRLSRLVKYRKDGQVIYYSLDDEHVYSLYATALEHVREQ